MQKDKGVHFLPGIKNVLVNGFQYQLSNIPESFGRFYFLTHYDPKHCQGLTPSWNHGRIFCSPITSNLLKNVFKFQSPELIHSIELNQRQTLTKDIDFLFLDSNFCPGAVMVIFFIKSKNLTYLHTGSMRFCQEMKLNPLFNNLKADMVFLDTTYAHPKHNFIPQSAVMENLVHISQDFLQKHSTKGLIYISNYQIGKEKLVLKLLEAISLPVYLNEETFTMLQYMPEFHPYFARNLLVRNPCLSRIHVVNESYASFIGSFFQPDFEKLQESLQEVNNQKRIYYQQQSNYNNPNQPNELLMSSFLTTPGTSASSSFSFNLDSNENTPNPSRPHSNKLPALELFTHVLAFLPTGWADYSNYNKTHPYQERENLAVQLVPYAEHSEYSELIEFVKFVKPREVVPTVFADVSNFILFFLHFLMFFLPFRIKIACIFYNSFEIISIDLLISKNSCRSLKNLRNRF
jgi:hypothetical protein